MLRSVGTACLCTDDEQKGERAMKSKHRTQESEQYLRFETDSVQIPKLPAHFARQNCTPTAVRVPDNYINWHESVEFLCVLSGDVHILRGEELLHPMKGEIVAIDPFMIHAPLFSTDATDLFYVKISPELYRESGLDYDGISHTPLIRDEEAFRLFSTLAELNEDRGSPVFVPRFKGTLLLLMARLYEHYSVKDGARTPPRGKLLSLVIPAIRYIHEHFTEKPSIAAVAEAAHISESHLLHSFRAATGMSVLQYINHLRFLYARTLFKTTEMTVGEVAAVCGFVSLSYFSKEYTRRMGISPSAERRSST